MSDIVYNKYYPNLFKPLIIRNKRLKSRIIAAPHGDMRMDNIDSRGYGIMSEEAARYYGSVARGGAAIVSSGAQGVDPRFYLGKHESYFDFFTTNLAVSRILPAMHRVTEQIHAYGSLAAMELNHGGQWCTPKDPDVKLMGPSTMVNIEGREVFGIDEEEMNRIADYFADAAYLAKRAGFDVINIHGGHNWLIGAFLSPLENFRTDEYGGSAINRARFPKMIAQRIRDRVGDDMLIEMRISCTELEPGGITIDEVTEVIDYLSDVVDIINCSAGKIHDSFTEAFTFPSQYMDEGVNTYLADYVKKHKKSNIFIEAVGGIHNPAFAEELVAEGSCDMVAMARSFIADADWGEKARQGHADDIRPCIRCLHCMDFGEPLDDSRAISYCSVNPRRAFVMNVPRPIMGDGRKKNVVVIGGGPAGMQAAMEIADRGHRVTLLEAGEKLGGRLEFADYITFKKGVKNFREYLIRQVNKRDIDVKLNTRATRSLVSELKPDAVIVATGAEKFIPPIKGVTSKGVIHASDIFKSFDSIGEKVVVIGGGEVGCELTIQLQSMGKTVDLIEVQDKLMKDSKCFWEEKEFTEFFLTHEFREGMRTFENVPEVDRVKIHLNSKCTEITDDGVIISENGEEKFISADTVILSTGLRTQKTVDGEFDGVADIVIYAGDCSEVSNIEYATRTGLNASFQL